ncbi:MAG: M28 family metallopeptidase [Cytophagales bacterium]|nr:M28 family metallopeptidase [Cytophagales bacterium]
MKLFNGILFAGSICLTLTSGLNVLAQKGHPELNSIDPNKIEGHMTFLADDLLKGRAVGSEEFEIASVYVQSQLLSMGLKPASSNGTFKQEVPFKQATVDTEKSYFTVNNQPLVWAEDFIISPYFEAEVSEIEAEMVFVGFGVSAPDFKYDDYAGIDVKNKIVIYINDAPAFLPSNEKAYFTTGNVKYETAIAKGAIGVINFMHPENNRRPWLGTVSRTRNGRFLWTNPEGKTPASFPEIKAAVTLNNEKLTKLFGDKLDSFEKALKSLDEGKSSSFELNTSAKIHVETKSKTVISHNLLAEIEGSDPKLKNEYLVYAAHLDHLGFGRTINGDSIYNGAHDNASGVAILLEIARTFKESKINHKRSVLFAIVTGEESGLLGSDYLANYPPEGKENMVANISMDMPFFFHPILDIVPYGAAHSSLGKKTEMATKILGLEISPDPFPQQVIFIRSDHYSFVRKGIPALFIKSGFKTIPEDTVDRSVSDLKWRSTHYHTPQDDMNQDFDFNAAATHVKINYLIGKMVLDDATKPTWNSGDFFGNRAKQ